MTRLEQFITDRQYRRWVLAHGAWPAILTVLACVFTITLAYMLIWGWLD